MRHPAQHVREWVTACTANGMSPSTLRTTKTVLSAIFTTALNDRVTVLHPCKGVKTPTVPRPLLRIATPEEFDSFYHHVTEPTYQLLAELTIESGLRWGEIAELRPKDLDQHTRILSVTRKVIELSTRFQIDGQHFHVQNYPKDKEPRRFKKISPHIVSKLKGHIETNSITKDDLFFVYLPTPPANRPPPHHPAPTSA